MFENNFNLQSKVATPPKTPEEKRTAAENHQKMENSRERADKYLRPTQQTLKPIR